MGGRLNVWRCPVCRRWLKSQGLRDHMRSSHLMKDVVFPSGDVPVYMPSGIESYTDLQDGRTKGPIRFFTQDEIDEREGSALWP